MPGEIPIDAVVQGEYMRWSLVEAGKRVEFQVSLPWVGEWTPKEHHLL